ncbi:MAG: PDZ domain-containing protein [Planctomycetes bacterium]|nr:PDZ domain-containing protein [Planctomycetota bacterium]
MKRFIFVLAMVTTAIFVWSCSAQPIEQKPDVPKILTTLQDDINQAVKAVEPSLAYAEIGSGRNVSGMTGLVISSSGEILLPAYLKKDSYDRVEVWLNDTGYEASLVQSDERLRVSIMKIQVEAPLTPVNFANADAVQTGQFVLGAVNGGKSNDFKVLVDVGFVRGRNDDGDFDQIQCPGLTSNQGAVMLTLDGRVIAVQLRGAGTSEYSRSLPQNWVVSNEVQKGIDKLTAKAQPSTGPGSNEEKDKGKPWLGFGWAPINEDYAEMIGLPKKGIIVKYTVKNSPMEQAGIKEGDLIIEVDNKPLTKVGAKALESQFVKYLDPEVGKEANLKVLRGADVIPVKVKFAKKPESKEFRADDIGVAVQDITDVDYYERGLFIREGVIVDNILPGSPAGTISGRSYLINRDDVIIELNKTPIKNVDDFIKAVEAIRRDKVAIVLVKTSNGISTSFTALNLKGKK